MPKRTITTTATGRIEERPTSATVEITTEAHAETPAGAHATVDDRTRSITDELVNGPVADDQVRVTTHRIDSPDQQFEPEVPGEYRGVRELSVDCLPETVSDIAWIAAEAGGTVSAVRFELPEERMEVLRDQAAAEAVEQARTRAERIATVETGTVGDVLSVTMAGADDNGMQSLVEEALEFGLETDLEPSPIVVTEAVEATFEFDPE